MDDEQAVLIKPAPRETQEPLPVIGTHEFLAQRAHQRASLVLSQPAKTKHLASDMTRAYQKGHARKVLRVEMMLPYRVPQSQPDNAVRERRPVYRVAASPQGQEKFPENSLNESRFAA